MPLASFSPRSQHMAIYLVGGFETRHHSVLARLGPHKYPARLADLVAEERQRRADFQACLAQAQEE